MHSADINSNTKVSSTEKSYFPLLFVHSMWSPVVLHRTPGLYLTHTEPAAHAGAGGGGWTGPAGLVSVWGNTATSLGTMTLDQVALRKTVRGAATIVRILDNTTRLWSTGVLSKRNYHTVLYLGCQSSKLSLRGNNYLEHCFVSIF